MYHNSYLTFIHRIKILNRCVLAVNTPRTKPQKYAVRYKNIHTYIIL